MVDGKTNDKTIAAAFDRFTVTRRDVAVLLINQHVSSSLFYRLG